MPDPHDAIDVGLDLKDAAIDVRDDSASPADWYARLLRALGDAVRELGAQPPARQAGCDSVRRAAEITAGLLLRARPGDDPLTVLGKLSKRHYEAAREAPGTSGSPVAMALDHVGQALRLLAAIPLDTLDNSQLPQVSPFMEGVTDQLVAALVYLG